MDKTRFDQTFRNISHHLIQLVGSRYCPIVLIWMIEGFVLNVVFPDDVVCLLQGKTVTLFADFQLFLRLHQLCNIGRGADISDASAVLVLQLVELHTVAPVLRILLDRRRLPVLIPLDTAIFCAAYRGPKHRTRISPAILKTPSGTLLRCPVHEKDPQTAVGDEDRIGHGLQGIFIVIICFTAPYRIDQLTQKNLFFILSIIAPTEYPHALVMLSPDSKQDMEFLFVIQLPADLLPQFSRILRVSHLYQAVSEERFHLLPGIACPFQQSL